MSTRRVDVERWRLHVGVGAKKKQQRGGELRTPESHPTVLPLARKKPDGALRMFARPGSSSNAGVTHGCGLKHDFPSTPTPLWLAS